MKEIFTKISVEAAKFQERTGKEFLSMAVGVLDPAVLPNETVSRLFQNAIQQTGQQNMLNYSLPQGIPPVREALTCLLSRQGLRVAPDTMLITSGGMEAISLAAFATLNKGDTVLCEGPGYPGALSLFELIGAKIVQIACGDQGVLPADLEAAIKEHKPKLVFLIPDGPSGEVMPLEHRKQIAGLLETYNLLAIEDGAYSWLQFDGQTVPSIQFFAPDRVLYATTVSKILAPAMRIGALIAPASYLNVASDMKSNINMQASAILQAITAEFLNPEDDFFDTYIKGLQTIYSERAAAMIAALQKYFPKETGYSWNTPKCGMFMWIKGPADFTELFEAALNNGVSYVPGQKFYVANNPDAKNLARLNFAGIPEDKSDEAIRRLAVTCGVV